MKNGLPRAASAFPAENAGKRNTKTRLMQAKRKKSAAQPVNA